MTIDYQVLGVPGLDNAVSMTIDTGTPLPDVGPQTSFKCAC